MIWRELILGYVFALEGEYQKISLSLSYTLVQFFTNNEILNLLAHQHHVIITMRTLKRLLKKHTVLEEIASFVDKEMAGNSFFLSFFSR